MSELWDKVKSHPWLIGGVAGIAILFLVYSSSGSSSSVDATQSSADDNQVASADALAAAQANANATVAQTQVAGQVQATQDQAALDALNITQSGTNLANELEANVQLSSLSEQQNVTDTANELTANVENTGNTLNANVAINSNATQQNIAQINANENEQDVGALTGALTSMAQISSNTTLGVADLQAGVLNNATSANEQIQTQSWFSKIFG